MWLAHGQLGEDARTEFALAGAAIDDAELPRFADETRSLAMSGPFWRVAVKGMWSVEQIRAAEDRLFETVPESVVMRRAAHGVALQAARLLAERTGQAAGRHVVLLTGAGNNGGDALWAGAFLRRRGVGVTAVLLAPDKTHPAGLDALLRAAGRTVSAEDPAASGVVERADLVIDGIVGLSARGGLRPTAAELVARVTAPIVSVDLPSGADPETGAVDGPAVSADITVTFGGRKPVHVLPPGAARCGRVDVVDIGLGGDRGSGLLAPARASTLEPADVGAAWPAPEPSDDKYSQGVVGIAAGSENYPGAAVLASGAAVHTTSGMVRYAGAAADVVRSHWPETVATGSITDAGRVQAWATGPGIGTGAGGVDVLARVLEAGRPVCADADAITLLAQRPQLWDARDPDTPLVLTPHAGEFERIAGEIGSDRVSAVRRAAERFSAVVLLKGHTTVIAEPGGGVLVQPAPSSWPATAGSGDVLTGMLGALLASGTDAWSAAGHAVVAHTLAADVAARGECGAGSGVPTSRGQTAETPGAPVGASDIVRAIPPAVRTLRAAALPGSVRTGARRA